MIIDCESCEMYQTPHCADCFVNAVLKKPDAALVIDDEARAAIAELERAGLASPIKYKRRAG